MCMHISGDLIKNGIQCRRVNTWWVTNKHYILAMRMLCQSTMVPFLSSCVWEAYLEQLQSYFVANDISTTGKKHAVLLSFCGTVMYKTIRSVLTPSKPTEVTYTDLTKKLIKNFSLTPSQIMQCFKFITCVRHPEEEKITTYVTQLRELMQRDTLDDML